MKDMFSRLTFKKQDSNDMSNDINDNADAGDYDEDEVKQVSWIYLIQNADDCIYQHPLLIVP